MKLTKAQKRYLLELLDDEERTYNGRAWRTLSRLKKLGLVDWNYSIRLSSSGSSAESYRTCLTIKGRQVAEELHLAAMLEGMR